jgi:hypothetical protein
MSKQHWMREAISYLQRVQNNCASKEFVRIRIGINGGFSAQFQLMASEFTRAFAAGNFKTPLVVFGMLNGYSEGEECKHVNYEWTCFFRPATKCEKEFEAHEAHEKNFQHLPLIENSIPPEFQHLGVAFWWGAVQRYLFRMQPFVEEHILQESKHAMHPVFSFPFGLPLVGLHVRRGDKHDDGFITHSFEEELAFVRKSPDCEVQNSRSDCFVRFNLNETITSEYILGLFESSVSFLPFGSNSTAPLVSKTQFIVNSALMKRTVILRLSDIDRFNYSSSNDEIAVNPKKLLNILRHRNHHNHLQHRHHFHSHNTRDRTALNNSSMPSISPLPLSEDDQKLLSETFVIPLNIFVASDDGNVVRAAGKLGYFADVTGVSQQTAATGMFKTLLSHHELGFNATMEIITDIFFLSQSSTLLGMAASQVYRLSVALSNVTSTLRQAKATDLNQIGRIKMLSQKYDVPFVENFE